MAGTQPVLGVYTLPWPTEYRFAVETRGGSSLMADGTIQHDLVQANLKYRFFLRWRLVSGSDMDTVITAYTVIKSASAQFTALSGSTYTVKRSDTAPAFEWTPELTKGGTELKYSSSILELVEQ